MTIAYRSSASAHDDLVSSLTISKPSGLANGDLMVAWLRCSNGVWNTPSGWTFQTGCTDASIDGRHLDCFYRYVTNAAGEPASYTFTHAGETAYVEGAIAAYSGAQPTPYAAKAWHNPTHWATGTTLADVAVRKDGVTVGFVGAGNNGIAFTTQSGYESRRNEDIYPGCLQVVDKGWTVDGYTGDIPGSTIGGTGEYNQSWHVSLANANQAPTAATNLYPASNINVNRVAEQQFSWTFNDPDTGDAESGYDLRYKKVADSAWTTVSRTTAETHHDFAGGTFAAAAYEWQVRTYDTSGEASPWTSSALFTGIEPPDGPTIRLPLNGSIVGDRVSVEWSVTDQAAYQMRTVADNAGAPNPGVVYTDTGTITNPVTRAHDATFGTNGRYEHVQVRVQYNALWSDWASVRVYVQFTAPAIPELSITNRIDGSIDIDITNPTPTGTQPAVLYNEVWIDDGIADLGPELLVNTTMEGSDPPAFWESNSAFGEFQQATVSRSSTQAYSGTYSTRAAWPNGGGAHCLLNHVGVWAMVTGRTYRFTARVFVPAGSPDVRPVLVFVDAGNPVTVKDQWVYVQWDFICPNDGAFVGFETDTSPSVGQYLYVDDASLREVVGGLTQRAASQAPNSTFRYYTARSGWDYDASHVRVKAVGSNGMTTWSSSLTYNRSGPNWLRVLTDSAQGMDFKTHRLSAPADFKTALASVASRAANILVLGDSVGEGVGASAGANRWVDKLRARLRTDYPVTGVLTDTRGFIAPFYTYGPWADPTLTGTAHTEVNTQDGFGGREVDLTTPDADPGASVAFPATTGVKVEVYYKGLAFFCGGFTVTINGTYTADVDCYIDPFDYTDGDRRPYFPDPDSTGTYVWRSGTLTRNAKTVTLAYDDVHGWDMETKILGVRVLDGDEGKGVHVWDGSKAGLRTADHLNNSHEIPHEIKADLVILACGLNDSQVLTPDEFYDDTVALIDKVRAERLGVPVLLVGMYEPERAPENVDPDWSHYMAALADAAAARTGVEFCNMADLFPPLGAYTDDGLHANDVGHGFIAQYVGDWIEDIHNDVDTAQATDSIEVVKNP